MNKIVLDCEVCRGTLEVTEDMELFRCEYCGMPYLVERKEGAVRITRLEARVRRVEQEQEKMRLDLVRTRLEDVRREIEMVYDELSSMPQHKVDGQFRAATAERLYLKELELRREYAQQAGEELAEDGYINLLDVMLLLKYAFPRWNLGVWFGVEKIGIFQPSLYCPGLKPKGLLGWASSQAIVSILRQSNEIKVRGIGGRDKKKLIAILQAKYLNRVVK